MMNEIRVKVPGRWTDELVAVDFETEKVPAPAGFRMKNGEALRRRWSITMAGIARDGEVVLLDRGTGPGFLTEFGLLSKIGAELAGACDLIYGATREFDEMIARGRFTNARRAHEPEPYFPAVPGADSLPWRNVGCLRHEGREPELSSREVTATRAGNLELCLVHLLRDVVELILMAGYPDAECEAWCRRVLADYSFASSALGR